MPIYEPALAKLVVSNYKAGRLSFKPDTDDMRDSPSIVIAEGMDFVRPLTPGVQTKPNVYATIEGVSGVVCITEWDAFLALESDRVKRIASAAVLVDVRDIYKPEEVQAKGFAYVSIGQAKTGTFINF